MRDPWDIATSMFKQRYIFNIPYSSSFFNIGVFLANFEAIVIFWIRNINNHNGLKIVKYEEVVSKQESARDDIYNFLGLNTNDYNEKKREDFFSSTASIRQVKSKIHQNSIKKKEFEIHKAEFYESLEMQKQFWISKGILSKSDDFFGYI